VGKNNSSCAHFAESLYRFSNFTDLAENYFSVWRPRFSSESSAKGTFLKLRLNVKVKREREKR
jgi:hypothetical protein